jgi:glycosyltransferase involved in cell wall biosynthesis
MMTNDVDNNRVPAIAESARRLRSSQSFRAYVAFAMRTRRRHAYDTLAWGATHGELLADDLVDLAVRYYDGEATGADYDMQNWDHEWLEALAEVLTSRGPESYLAAVALYVLTQSISGNRPMGQESATIYAQLLAATGRFDKLDPGLVASLDKDYRWSVRLDSVNPFTSQSGDRSKWLDRLNDLFTPNGLEPVSLAESKANTQVPFELLTCEPTAYIEDPSKVTVIMSAYRPGTEILASVESILKQSWKNLELIVIDDASGSDYSPILEQVEASDPRIRLLRNSNNMGTYAIRNKAMQMATGDYVAFQDSDDWSHPRRLEYQVRAIRSKPEILASRIPCVRLFPDLASSYPGYPPNRICAVSLLFERRHVMELIGGFDHVRKSADIEFPARLAAVAPGSLDDQQAGPPLVIYQLRGGSLSRDDAMPGWLRWNRIAYRDSYQFWHDAIKSNRSAARIDQLSTRPFPIPDPSFSPERNFEEDRPYDLVVVDDFRGARQQLDEYAQSVIRSAVRSGLRTAIAYVETSGPPTERRSRLAQPVQELINNGTIDLVHVSSSVQARTVLISSSDILLEPPDVIELKTDRVIVAMRGRLTSNDVDKDVRSCVLAARRLFGSTVNWLPADPEMHRALIANVDHDDEVAELESGMTRSARDVERSRHQPTRHPIVGRVAPEEDWPDSVGDLVGAYPIDKRFDVRILGSAAAALRLLGRTSAPPNWVAVDAKRVSLSRFVARTDFVVLTGMSPHERGMDGALAAMRCGSVVIASPAWRTKLGQGAIYSEPSGVAEVLLRLRGDAPALAEQRARGYEHAGGYYSTAQHVWATERVLGLRSPS